MKEIVKQRIKEYYKDYLKQTNETNYEKRMKYKYENSYSESELDEWVLKVLVDIYTTPEDDENRLIYHDWDIIESTIGLICEEDKND